MNIEIQNSIDAYQQAVTQYKSTRSIEDYKAMLAAWYKMSESIVKYNSKS